MSSPAENVAQHPLNLVVPIKSWLQLKELQAVVHLKVREMVKSSDTIGTLHFARFFDFRDHNQLALFTVYDGSFEDYSHDFLKFIGPVFELLNKHVVDPAPDPITKYPEEWIKWATEHDLQGIGFYSAYPNLSVQDIRARAGVTHGSVDEGQIPLGVLIPAKSPNHFGALIEVIAQSLPKFREAADASGMLHFARFVPLGTKAVVLIAEYDRALEEHGGEILKALGPTLDKMFENVTDPPPTPVERNVSALLSWIGKHSIKPWVSYTAYPSLTAQEVRSGAEAH